MSTLARWFTVLSCILIPAVTHADELLADLEELYTLTENCSEQTEIALRWGMVLRQSPMRSPKRQELLESVYQKALVSCAQPSIRAQAILSLALSHLEMEIFPERKNYSLNYSTVTAMISW